MKLYLASAAPGTEAVKGRSMCSISTRLLSYYSILTHDLYCNLIFKEIKRIKQRLRK